MPTGTLSADALSPERFGEFFSLIKPKPEELRWTEVAWETDLWEARRKAADVGKPVFLWGMNGDPLGCV